MHLRFWFFGVDVSTLFGSYRIQGAHPVLMVNAVWLPDGFVKFLARPPYRPDGEESIEMSTSDIMKFAFALTGVDRRSAV